MSRRKTIAVDRLLEIVNERLALSDAHQVETRVALESLMSDVLRETRNYRGFKFIAKGDETIQNGWGYDYETKEYNDRSRVQLM